MSFSILYVTYSWHDSWMSGYFHNDYTINIALHNKDKPTSPLSKLDLALPAFIMFLVDEGSSYIILIKTQPLLKHDQF